MGALTRLRYVITANINALLEKAENPEKLLRTLIREMEEAFRDARAASAELLSEQQKLRRQKILTQRAIDEWKQRAEQAVSESRDDLARTALNSKQQMQTSLGHIEAVLEDTDSRISQLKTDMQGLQQKLAQAKSKLQQMQRKPGKPITNGAPAQMTSSRGERKLDNALQRFDRLETHIEQLEARVQAYDLAPAPRPQTIDSGPTDPRIEAELATLKSRLQSNTEPQTAQGAAQ